MLSGVAVGLAFRRNPIRFISKIITVLIWVLLFLLGVEVGGNPLIMGSMHDLGMEALILTLAGLSGSMAMAWGLWRIVSRGDRSDEE